MATHTPLPPWIKRRFQMDRQYLQTDRILQEHGIQTICTNARCPNKGECFSRGTATVLILGNICTRNCPFCAVGHGRPLPPDEDEPDKILQVAQLLGLEYLVITSVDRDDLPDGGASHFARVVDSCRASRSSMRFELLTGDFRDSQELSLETLLPSLPFVYSHNVETVPSLYQTARPGGDYKRSLRLLALASKLFPDTPIKSSIMLGLGERQEEVLQVLDDLLEAGCERVAIGQYLRPDKNALEVKEFIHPDTFLWWGQKAKEMGFSWVSSSVFTRSSYHAES